MRWRLAAWAYLVLTLASGVLLRYQWTGAGRPLFDGRYLLHAHSHVALLGWAFVAVFLVLLGRPDPAGGTEAAGTRVGPLGEAAFHALVLGMFTAFLLQGYAFWSILLSMLHIGVGFGVVIFWMRRVRPHESRASRPWLDLSMLAFVVATLGPWMLALGGRMGEAWIEAWVGFYLGLLFHGWLAFVVLGLLVREDRVRVPRAAWLLMAAGVLPSVLPRMTGIVGGPGPAWVGWMGSVALGAGLVVAAGAVAGAALRPTAGSRATVDRLLLASVALAAGLAGAFLAVGTFPPLAEAVLSQRNLVVGYVHLLLLGFTTAALVLVLPLPDGVPGVRRFLGVGLLLAGTWTMVLILLGVGGAALLGRPAFWPVQWTLTWAGVASLAGGVLLLPPLRSSSG